MAGKGNGSVTCLNCYAEGKYNRVNHVVLLVIPLLIYYNKSDTL